ncbi:MAG: DUF6132 family protein [Bacteroidales bacterium]|jgi:xanthine/uracil permease
MKVINRNNILIFSGILTGILGGYLYYYFIGCRSGSCAITSSPWLSMLWGAAVGYLLFNMFRKKKKEAPPNQG